MQGIGAVSPQFGKSTRPRFDDDVPTTKGAGDVKKPFQLDRKKQTVDLTNLVDTFVAQPK